ncbi:AUGMIN subunit 1-like isoform X2 [Aristolochia californica]
MEFKQRQYSIESENYKELLSRVAYSPDINHRVLIDLLQHKTRLERKTKPVLETLRCYQNLPPDKTLATLAIEKKRREYEAASNRLEDLVQALELRE